MKQRMILSLALILFVVLAICLRLPTDKPDQRGAPADELTQNTQTQGNVERTDYVDEKGRVTYARDKRWATKVVTRDGARHTALEEYFDENGAPAPQSGGNYAVLRAYDDNDKNTLVTYLDAGGRPMNTTNGYARIIKAYDDRGRQTTEFYFDAGGAAAVSTNGAHGFRREYPDEGRDYRMTYLGLDGRTVAIRTGYAVVARRLNDKSKVVEERYFDANGAPCPAKDGEYGFQKEYDDEGHETSVVYLDAAGKPARTRRGYAIVKKRYDAKGKLITQMYYDAQGRPATNPRGHYGTDESRGVSTPLTRSGRVKLDLDHILRTYPMSVVALCLIATALSALLSKRLNVLMLAGYLGFIAYMTLMYRAEVGNRINLEPFWSYRLSLTSAATRREIIDNILLFVPLGAMMYRLFGSPWALLVPLMLSVSVELAQYTFAIGLCEFDDVFNNTMGGCIGYLMGMAMRWPFPEKDGAVPL